MYEVSDIFIGDFPVTQDFGADPATYSARYGLKGHNGTDFGCPSMTPILATADGWVSEVGFDAAGYGKYIKIVHNGFLSLYGHLNDAIVNVKDKVVAGQLIGHSNNSGFSTGPHLHFGIAPCDINGIKTDPNNGYSGYIDPMGNQCHWTIKNPTAPVVQNNDNKPPVQVPFDTYPIIISQGSNYKLIAEYLLSHNLNDFLTTHQQSPIDLQNNAGDPEGGQKIVMFLTDMLNQLQTAKEQQQTQTQDTQVSQVVTNPTPQQQIGIGKAILQAIKGFVFAQS